MPPLAAVIEGLPGFSLSARAFSDSEQAYLDYYGLDLGKSFPGVGHCFGTVSSRGESLAVQAWRTPGARTTLMLVHGYFDHVGLYTHLVRFGLLRGCNVLTFDLPGHGLSGGNRADIEDFTDYSAAIRTVREAAADLGERWQVIGQSTGAAAIMDCLGSYPALRFERVVLLAPLVEPGNWLLVRLAQMLVKPFTASIRRSFAENSHDRAFLAFLQQEPLQTRVIPLAWVGALQRWLREFKQRPANPTPLLVVQGDEDGTVAWRRNLAWIRCLFPATEVYILPTGRHHLANESPELRSRYLARVAAFLDSDTLPG